jgi:LemA protein
MSWWIVPVVVLLYLVVRGYNGLVRSRERTREGWSGVEVQLQRRADLVPNLVEVVRGYASHEREAFEEAIRARAAVHSADKVGEASAANRRMSGSVDRLFAVAEAYPDLEALESFLALQEELSDVEEKISYARQFYNRNVLDLNTRIRRFPTLFIARAFRFRPEEFFDADETGAVGVRFSGTHGAPEQE